MLVLTFYPLAPWGASGFCVLQSTRLNPGTSLKRIFIYVIYYLLFVAITHFVPSTRMGPS